MAFVGRGIIDLIHVCGVKNRAERKLRKTMRFDELILDFAHVRPGHAVYIDDRAMFVEAAQGLRIQGIIYTPFRSDKDRS